MVKLKETRLNNRWLDLRVPSNNAIMRIRSGVSLLFREYLDSQGNIKHMPIIFIFKL